MGQISLKGRDPAEILTDIYIALMLGVFLLFPGFGGYMTTTEDKFRLLCWLTGGYMLISLLLPLELKLVGGRGSGSPAALLKGSAWAQRLIFLYLIWTALSAALSIDPHRADVLRGVPLRILCGKAEKVASVAVRREHFPLQHRRADTAGGL